MATKPKTEQTTPDYPHKQSLSRWGVEADTLVRLTNQGIESYTHGSNVRAMLGDETEYGPDEQRELRQQMTEARNALLRGTPAPEFPFNARRHGDFWEKCAAACLAALAHHEGFNYEVSAKQAACYADAMAFERSRRADEYDAAMSEATPLWDAWEDAQK